MLVYPHLSQSGGASSFPVAGRGKSKNDSCLHSDFELNKGTESTNEFLLEKRGKRSSNGIQVDIHIWENHSKPTAGPSRAHRLNSNSVSRSSRSAVFSHTKTSNPRQAFPSQGSKVSILPPSLYFQALCTRSTPDLNARPQRPAPNVQPSTTKAPRPSRSPFHSPMRLGTLTWKEAKGPLTPTCL